MYCQQFSGSERARNLCDVTPRSAAGRASARRLNGVAAFPVQSRERAEPRISDVMAHGAFGGIRIARCQCLENFAVLTECLLGAPGTRAGAKALNPQLVIQFVQQHLLEPLAARGPYDREMIVLIARSLVVGGA